MKEFHGSDPEETVKKMAEIKANIKELFMKKDAIRNCVKLLEMDPKTLKPR